VVWVGGGVGEKQQQQHEPLVFEQQKQES